MTRLIEPLSADERLALIAAARSFLGVPFRHQGRTVKGMDCIGLIVLAFAAIGKPLRNRSDYGRLPANAKLDRELLEHFGEGFAPDYLEPQPGDVVSMTWAKEAAHVAIITPHPDRRIGLIHSSRDFDRVVEHGIDADWRSRIVKVYRP